MKSSHAVIALGLSNILLQGLANDGIVFGQTGEIICPHDGSENLLQKPSVSSAENENRIMTSGMPSTGTTRALVIFVKFSDDDFTNACSGTTDGWNPSTYNTARPPWTNDFIDASVQSPQTEGSISDYFDKLSFGQFRLIGDIFPPDNNVYVPEHEQSYYSLANGRGISFLHEEIFTNLDPIIDYSLYDTNPADGVVDMIFMIYRSLDIPALVGSATWTGIATLNPNTYYGNGGTDNFPLTFDGVEIRGVPGPLSCNLGSGVILQHSYILDDVRQLAAHELAHHWFGCTHFSNHLGFFGYSDRGYSGAGRGGFDKLLLGWITPTVIDENTENLTIRDLNTYGDLYRINIPGTNRFFLLENRQYLSDYDQTWEDHCDRLGGLPATGLLITETSATVPTHIEAADGNYADPGDSGDTFKPGNKIQFTPWTQPNSNNGSTPTGIAVTNIRQSGNDIIVDIDLDFSSGEITEDSWWDGTIDITGDITVASGKTLTVNANTTVDFATDAKLIVNGTLQAAGTSQQRITLDRSGGSGTWGGIEFNSGSSGTIGYTTIDHVAKGVKATSTGNVTISNASMIQNFTEQAVYASNSSITVQNSTIQNPADASHGIYLLGGSSTPTISGNTIDGPTIGIEREDNPGAATIENNTIINCTNGIKTTQSAPTIRKNAFYGNIYGIRLATGSSPNIHDNDFYDNAIGVLLDQSQPAQIKWNNFGWSGSIEVHADEGIMVFYLNGGNTFLSGKWNNFYDGDVTKDISNPTGTMLNATGNYWYSLSVAGNVDTSSPQGSHNNDAGPGGASTSKVAGGDGEDEVPRHTTIPERFVLEQNFPNPFNPSTMIGLQLPHKASVTLEIYDVMGNKMKTLASALVLDAGRHTFIWDGKNDQDTVIASGIYIYRTQIQPFSSSAPVELSRKLILVR